MKATKRLLVAQTIAIIWASCAPVVGNTALGQSSAPVYALYVTEGLTAEDVAGRYAFQFQRVDLQSSTFTRGGFELVLKSTRKGLPGGDELAKNPEMKTGYGVPFLWRERVSGPRRLRQCAPGTG